jgi:nitrate/nitrite transport system ATP-binding protein
MVTQSQPLEPSKQSSKASKLKVCLRQVSKTFQGEQKWIDRIIGRSPPAFNVLSDINVDIDNGSFVTLIGPSGCGKSTLLKIVAGLTRETSGSVFINGTPIVGPGPDRGIIFQDYSLLPWMNVEENIRFAVETVYPNMQRSKQKQLVNEHVHLVGLRGTEKKYSSQLSGGMQQRVGIARTLAFDPDILLMDEPFGALDALTRGFLEDEVERIWEQRSKTVIMVTHSIEESLLLSDKIVMMTRGPAAKIAEVLDVPFPRPRDRQQVIQHPSYNDLKSSMERHLYRETRKVEESRI